MKNLKTLLSSKNMDWETPQDFFDELNNKFNFTLDPCATHANAKCKNYYTQAENGLTKNWGGHTVFCNPPYGRAIKEWVKKCHDEALNNNALVVMLVPARTDTAYFHKYIYNNPCAKIIFIKGRLKFGGNQQGSGAAPFPSMLVIFNNRKGTE